MTRRSTSPLETATTRPATGGTSDSSRLLTRSLPLACALAVLFGGFFLESQAFAQQAIVSLPSADLTPRRKLFGMVESQFRPIGPKPYYNSTTFFCFGLDDTTELAVSLYNAGAPSTGNMTVANGFKSVFPLFRGELDRWEPKVTVGMMGLFSVAERGLGL